MSDETPEALYRRLWPSRAPGEVHDWSKVDLGARPIMMTSKVAELRLRRLECELEIERAHAEYTQELSRVLWRGAVPWDLRALRVAEARKVLRERVRKALDGLLEDSEEDILREVLGRAECDTCHDHSATCPDCAKVDEDDERKWPV